MKPLMRWTIGTLNNSGYECLEKSIDSFTHFYDVDVIICHNGEPPSLPYTLYDQRKNYEIKPVGVTWKLYPPRLAIDRYEISIDNDIIINSHIPQIDYFLENDCTLLLEGNSRTYGRFEKHVPTGMCINSGIYGMPPGFNLEKYFNFYVKGDWELNATGRHEANKSFDEQGLIALSLLSYPRTTIIPQNIITNCELQLVEGLGYHFIGLNRRIEHTPYEQWKNK